MEDFEQEGVVSLWAFLKPENPADVNKDVLLDFCAVEDYDADFQEGVLCEEQQPIADLVFQLSGSKSYLDDVVRVAARKGIEKAYGIIAQFDFAYDPTKITKKVAADPVFIGYFPWND